MSKALYGEAEQYMLQCMQDSAYDVQHIYRVLHLARSLAAYEPEVNNYVLTLACLLHDIGRSAQNQDETVCHAAVGAHMAYLWLLAHKCDPSSAAHVRHCIAAHRYRTGCAAQTREAKLLYDADKLDACGAIGVARTLLYEGRAGHPLYTCAPDGSICDGGSGKAPSFAYEYINKMKRLETSFYTVRAKEVALQRIKAAESFYESLMAEAREASVCPGT